MIRIGFIFWLVLSAVQPVIAQAQPSTQPVVRIGVLAYRGHADAIATWQPTIQYLQQQIPEHRFELVSLNFERIARAVGAREIDFVITTPASYVELENRYGATRILTLVSLRNGIPYTHYAGLIIARAERSDLVNLEDLRGKRFMAADRKAFGGWWMQLREMQEHGIDPDRDFKPLEFAGTHDAVVYAIRDRKADAGAVRWDILEEMAAEGKINPRDFKVVHEQAVTAEYPFRRSTRLYPNWPIARLSQTNLDLSRKIVLALLNLTPDHPASLAARSAGWTTPVNYISVHECLQSLRVTPYEQFGHVTLAEAALQHQILTSVIATSLVLLLVATLFLLRYSRQVQRAARAERAASEKLAEAQSHIVQTEKLAAMGQLVAGVAHEVNNPLSFVSNNTAVLQRDLHAIRHLLELYQQSDGLIAAGNPQLMDHINHQAQRVDLAYTLPNIDEMLLRSRDGLNRIRQIVKDLRDFARLDETDMHETDLRVGVESTINILRPMAKEKQVTIALEARDIPPVQCYPAKINQVTMNLVANAIDACPEKGQVRVLLGPVETNGGVQLEVIDTGPGVPEEIRDRIFDPFFTTKPQGQGTGLGLSITYGIVRDHGGSISVRNEPHGGARFTVTLPRTLPVKPA